jgi:hypothetical protein
MNVEIERNHILPALSVGEKFNSLLSCSLSIEQTCVVVPAVWRGVKIVVPAAGGGTEDDG